MSNYTFNNSSGITKKETREINAMNYRQLQDKRRETSLRQAKAEYNVNYSGGSPENHQKYIDYLQKVIQYINKKMKEIEDKKRENENRRYSMYNKGGRRTRRNNRSKRSTRRR